MPQHRIYDTAFAEVYPHYLAKVIKKGRTEEELLELIEWLTGYIQEEILEINLNKITFKEFFERAPKMNPNKSLIKGVVCKVRVEDVEEPLMQNIRYLDKIIDELTRGKSMEKIKRK